MRTTSKFSPRERRQIYRDAIAAWESPARNSTGEKIEVSPETSEGFCRYFEEVKGIDRNNLYIDLPELKSYSGIPEHISNFNIYHYRGDGTDVIGRGQRLEALKSALSELVLYGGLTTTKRYWIGNVRVSKFKYRVAAILSSGKLGQWMLRTLFFIARKKHLEIIKNDVKKLQIELVKRNADYSDFTLAASFLFKK